MMMRSSISSSGDLVVDGSQRAQKLLENVGQHGGFSGADAILRQKHKDFAEDGLHLGCGSDFGEITQKEGARD